MRAAGWHLAAVFLTTIGAAGGPASGASGGAIGDTTGGADSIPSALTSDSTRVLTGGVTMHTVRPGDSLVAIAARYGVDVAVLARENDLATSARLMPGMALRVDNRHLAPSAISEIGLVVNVPQRMLFTDVDGTLRGLPAAVGRATWRTPLGAFTVVNAERNPTWDVPASIQAEALRQGRQLPARVSPGPDNPLGAFWLGLSVGGVGIHGTNAPTSIYRVTTHGCIRLHPDDIAWLFTRTPRGTAGRIVYEPVLLADVDGVVYLEVHPDVYRRATMSIAALRERAAAMGLAERIDWPAAERVLSAKDGIARVVSAAGAAAVVER